MMKNLYSILVCLVFCFLLSCKSEKGQDSPTPAKPSVSENSSVSTKTKENNILPKFVYIDRMNVLHIQASRTSLRRSSKQICSNINIGYHRILVNDIKEKDLEWACPYCISDSIYSLLEEAINSKQ